MAAAAVAVRPLSLRGARLDAGATGIGWQRVGSHLALGSDFAPGRSASAGCGLSWAGRHAGRRGALDAGAREGLGPLLLAAPPACHGRHGGVCRRPSVGVANVAAVQLVGVSAAAACRAWEWPFLRGAAPSTSLPGQACAVMGGRVFLPAAAVARCWWVAFGIVGWSECGSFESIEVRRQQSGPSRLESLDWP